MVTWWKKVRYNRITKFLACVLLSIAVLFVVQGGLIIEEAYHNEPYNQNITVQYELVRKAGYVRDWIVRYADESIFDETQITEEEVSAYIQNSEALSGHLEINESEAIAEQTESTTEQTESTAEAEKLVIEQAKKGILADRKAYKLQIEDALTNPNILYLGLNKETGQVLTNITWYNERNREEVIKTLTSKPLYLKGNGATLTIYEGNNIQEGEFLSYYRGKPFVTQNNYEVYVALADKLVPGDVFYDQNLKYTQLEAAKPIAMIEAIIGAILIIMIGLYGLKAVGKSSQGEDRIVMYKINEIPFEIQGILMIVLGLIWLELARQIPQVMTTFSQVFFDIRGYGLAYLRLYLLFTFGMMIGVVPLISLLKHIKNKSVKQNWLCIRLSYKIGNAIREDNLIGWVIGGSIVYILMIVFCVFLMVIGTGRILGLLLWGLIMLMLVGAAVGLIKLARDYVKIAKASLKIVQGDLETKINLTHTLPLMQQMADNINNIGQGLEKAVAESVKSERLKTELITNVSHDLKTPLTSIISYIDLLKDEQIENKVASEYIEVLAERSNRLKQLVEDLVEASKAATGNIKADLQVIKLNELVMQAVGEYSDRLEQSELEVVAKPLEEVSVLADGRHMWRIIENLLSNVSKYAMPHTRVYVEVRREGEYGKLIIKNIAKESLNLMDVSELTERFVRGDDSRTTEGSGLGLAIAQSLTQIQGGKLSIHLDGDLFKVEVSMPCSK